MTRTTPNDRPREKLERGGPAALGDNELLALLVGHGTSRDSALAVADQMIATAGGLHRVRQMSPAELTRIPGVGLAIAGRVQAAIEIGRRMLAASVERSHRFAAASDCGVFLLPQFGSHPVERFGVMLLDSRQRLIRVEIVGVGSTDAVVVHPREVFRAAILERASSIVAFHNHPTGDVTPSRDDLILTRRLIQAGELVGIDVADHLILGETRYCSVREAMFLEWHG